MIRLLIIFLLIFTSGCSYITNGSVVDKQFVPEHEIQVDDPDITIGDFTIPGMETVPDSWYITFGKEDEDGKYKERTVQVDFVTYEQHQEGDWINFDTE